MIVVFAHFGCGLLVCCVVASVCFGWCFATFSLFSLCGCFVFIVGVVSLGFGAWVGCGGVEFLATFRLAFWCG